MPQHAQRRRKKPDVTEPAPVAAPEPALASQLGEIERIHLAAGRDATKIPHASQIRIDAILREMAAGEVRYRLPSWLTKSIRMRIRRAAARPEKAPKIRKPRKPTPPPVPPVKTDTGWRVDENGVRSREVVTA